MGHYTQDPCSPRFRRFRSSSSPPPPRTSLSPPTPTPSGLARWVPSSRTSPPATAALTAPLASTARKRNPIAELEAYPTTHEWRRRDLLTLATWMDGEGNA